MATNTKLSNPVSGYSIFKTNQLLTAEHLNSIGRFFDYHDRLTRARLLGVGIVCGLHIQFDARQLILSKGVGVTSDGDLLSVDGDLSFAGLATYNDKDAGYDVFKNLSEGGNASGLWQFTNNNVEDGFIPISDFFGRENIPENYVVILYSSQYVKDTDNCSGEDCDGKADMYTNGQHILLLHKNDYDRIIKESKCTCDNYFDLPEVSIPRVLLNEKDSIFSYNDLLTAYGNTISNATKILELPLKSASETALLLNDCYYANGGQKNFFTAKEADALSHLQELVKTSISEKSQGIQYVYDMLKDVCNAYNEFKESAFDLCQGCCVAPDAFAKHLALGLLQNSELEKSHQVYRNCFIESPILNNKDEALEDALKLFARLAKLILNFSIPVRATIRITPSADISEILEKKSIPYYYDVTNILEDWSPTAYRRQRTATILSYHASTYSSLPHVVEPLAYDVDKYSFFKIEGHIGKSYDDAYVTIDNLRKQYDLPFDIAGVQLQKEKIRFIPPKFIKPGILDLLYDKEKLLLNTKLDFVKKYNELIAVNLPDDKELDQPAITKEYGDPKALKNMVLNKKTELDTHIASAKSILSKPVTETAGNVAWDDLHLVMANAGAQISKNAKLFTSAAYRSPIETLAVLEQPKTLQWLGDLLLQKKQQIEDGYIFSNFLKQNPSMLHNAGVSKGGTFILVYEKTGATETVVADFYLPYIAKADLVETTTDTSSITVRPIKEIDFTISKDILKKPILNAEIYNISDDLVKVKNLTSKADILLNQKINEFDGRITKVGEKVLLNEQSIIQQVGVVKDKYESSFSKLISSYDTVVTKTNVKVNDKLTGDFTREEFDALVTGVRTEFNGKISELESNVNTKFTGINREVTENKILIQKNNTDLTSLDAKMALTKNELATKAEQDIKSVNDRITSIGSALDGKITQNGVSLDTKLSVAIAGLDQKINTNSVAYDQKLATTRAEILTTTDKNVNEKLTLQKQTIDASITKINSDIVKLKPR